MVPAFLVSNLLHSTVRSEIDAQITSFEISSLLSSCFLTDFHFKDACVNGSFYVRYTYAGDGRRYKYKCVYARIISAMRCQRDFVRDGFNWSQCRLQANR